MFRLIKSYQFDLLWTGCIQTLFGTSWLCLRIIDLSRTVMLMVLLSHILHYYLLPAKRDTELISRLWSAKIFPTVRARRSRFKNSFILYEYCPYWTIFNATCSSNFECMLRMLLVLIQPGGCHVPIKVIVVCVCMCSYQRWRQWDPRRVNTLCYTWHYRTLACWSEQVSCWWLPSMRNSCRMRSVTA